MAINTSNNKVRIISTTVGLANSSKYTEINSPALVVNTSDGGIFYADGTGSNPFKQLAALPNHSHSGYLPLTGGTVYSGSNTPLGIKTTSPDAWSGIRFYDSTGATYAGFGAGKDKLLFVDSSFTKTSEILHAANFNTYSPKLNGTGATGTWPISISGNAATATSSDTTNALNITGLLKESDITESKIRGYQGVGDTWTGDLISMAYAGILSFGNPSRGWQLWAAREGVQHGVKGMRFRVGDSTGEDWAVERIILDSTNYGEYCASTGHTHSGYLSTSGGMIYGNGADLLGVNRIDGYPVIVFYHNNTTMGRLGFNTTGEAVAQIGGEYKTILHSGNVGDYTAGKSNQLATARTIWGQNFNGTANIDSGININSYFTSGTVAKISDLGDRGLVVGIGDSRDNWGMGFWIEGNGKGYIQQQAFTSAATTYSLCLQPFGGNVGIGTNDPSEQLHVNGNVKATKFIGTLQGNADTATTATTATSASSATRAARFLTDPDNIVNQDDAYNPAAGLHCYKVKADVSNNNNDGFILQWSWAAGSVGGQIYIDDNPSNTMMIRGRETSSGAFTKWNKFLHSGNYTSYCSSLGHTHNYIPTSEKVNAAAVAHTGYGTNGTYVPTMNFLSYWNGAYNSGNASNLTYCKHGAFGTIVTKSASDYLSKSGGTLTSAGVTTLNLKDTARNESAISYYGNSGIQWFVGKGVGSIGEKFGFYNGTAGVVVNIDVSGNITAPKFIGNLAGNADTASTATSAGHVKVTACNSTTNSKLWDDITVDTLRAKFYDVYNDGGPSTYGNILEINGISSYWKPQLWFEGRGDNGGRIFYRNRGYNSTSWLDWKTLAFTSDIPTSLPANGGNATSADKATCVVDYGNANSNIYIGFAGTGLTSTTCTHLAGYTSSGTKIKDITAAEVKKWLSLGSAAYTSSGDYATSSHGHSGYLSTSGGDMTSGARISASGGDLNLGNVSNAAWVNIQDMRSAAGSSGWYVYTDGKAYFAKDVSANNFITASDKRLKKNITEITNASKSLDLTFYEFDYKNTEGHSAGHIAQEVREVYPEFVRGNETEDEHLSIDYTALQAVQIKALIDEINKLKEEIRSLKSSNIKLK